MIESEPIYYSSNGQKIKFKYINVEENTFKSISSNSCKTNNLDVAPREPQNKNRLDKSKLDLITPIRNHK